MEQTYTNKERNRYLLGLSGQNILYGIISSSLAYYLQFTVLIPAMWVGVILSVSRMVDAVKDPFIGASLSKSKRSFRDYLCVVPIPTAILTVCCFANGVYSPTNSPAQNIMIIASAFFFYILWEIVFSVGDIPLTGYPAVLTNNESERTKLLSLRPIGSMASCISVLSTQPIAFALSSALGGESADERNAFFIVAVFFSVIGGALFQLTAIGSNQKVKQTNRGDVNSFKYIVTNPLLRKITVSGILGSLKYMTGVILTPLVTYYFASKNSALTLLYTTLWGAGSFVGQIVSMVSVPKLIQKFGAKKLYVNVNLINVIPNIILFYLYWKYPQNMTDLPQTIAMFILTLIIGSCVSISTTVQLLIISEAVDLEEKRSGNRPTALFFSMQTFLIKAGTAVSSLVAGLSYNLIHFSSAETQLLNVFITNGGIPRLEPQYQPFLASLFFLYTVPVAVSSLLSAVPFWEKRKKVRKIIRKII